MNIEAKVFNKIVAKKKKNPSLTGSYTLIKWDLPQGCKDFSISTNQSYAINYINIKSHMIISTDA